MTSAQESMFRLSNEPGSLGLSCTENGLALAGVPLLRQVGKRFERRPRTEIQRLISSAYRVDADVTPLIEGLGVVARALNSGDVVRAMVAAVQLRLPELDWDGAVRIAQADESLSKYDPNQPRDWHGRWTTGGGSGSQTTPMPVAFPSRRPASTGTSSPAGGAIATTSDAAAGPSAAGAASAAPSGPAGASSQDWVRLPPGQRIDELGDLLEWIANAKPEEERAIRAEIKRIYFDVGDRRGGEALNRALSEALYDGPLSRQEREALLEGYEPYTRADPAEMGRISRDSLVFGLLGPLAAAPEAAEVATTDIWGLGWAARGRVVEAALGANLPRNFPVIDGFAGGVATSIKSVDLNAAVYRNEARLLGRINAYVDQLAEFAGAEHADQAISPAQITGRVLKMAVPKGSMSPAQRAAIEAAKERAKGLGVKLVVTPF